MKFKQLFGDRVLVQIDAAPTVTPGGIQLPDSTKQYASRGELLTGTVVMVGEGRPRLPLPDFLVTPKFSADAADKQENIKLSSQSLFIPSNVKVDDRVVLAPACGCEYKEGETRFRVVSEDEIYGLLDE